LISQEEEEDYIHSLARAEEEINVERAERGREDVFLASLLTYRHEKEWLELGVDELRRIAAMFGISHARAQALEASDLNANK
jgi:hypothetical protein